MPLNLGDRRSYVRVIRGQAPPPRPAEEIANDRADAAYRQWMADQVGTEGAVMVLPADEMRVRMQYRIPHYYTETPVDRLMARIRGGRRG